jgi:hypothetical protein
VAGKNRHNGSFPRDVSRSEPLKAAFSPKKSKKAIFLVDLNGLLR